MGPRQPTAEHVLSAVVQASGISLDTLLGRRSRHEIVRLRAIAAVILRSEAGQTATEAGRSLLRSRQAVHNLTAKAAPGSDPAAAEVVTQVREALYHAIQSVPQSSLDGPDAPCSPDTCYALPQLRNTAEPTISKRSPRKPRAHRLPGLLGCRLAAGLTQADLAARAGISHETLLRLEHGRPATAESVARLAGALMVSIRALTGDPEFDHVVTVRFRTCTKCQALKRLTAFVPIKGCRGHYGRCRACRAAAAKQRYHSSEQVRIAEIERARRNRRRGFSAAA
jgi:DNA-binding XRE family transcriptional regulator